MFQDPDQLSASLGFFDFTMVSPIELISPVAINLWHLRNILDSWICVHCLYWTESSLGKRKFFFLKTRLC